MSSAQIEASIQAYQGMISVDQKGVLAEYVMRRKAVLHLFDHLREYEDLDKERAHREAALHSLICPMGTDSSKLEFDDHNLWMVDDRLAFFAYFASDKRLKTYVDSPSIERPDITFFYDTCFAWRGEGEASNTIVLVEFKRPNRDDYTGNDIRCVRSATTCGTYRPQATSWTRRVRRHRGACATQHTTAT